MTSTDHSPKAPDSHTDAPIPWWSRLAGGSLSLVTVLAYTIAAGFWQYLTTGKVVNFRESAYRVSFQTTLAEVFRTPVNVLTHPWSILVLGCLLGALITVPIVLAGRGKTTRSLILVIVLVVFGHMSWLAMALAAGCLLAHLAARRIELTWLAWAIGLLPAMVYLVVASLLGSHAMVLLPLQRWLLTVPLLVSAVTAIVGGIVALGLAKVPGVRRIAEGVVVVIIVGISALAFFSRIGPDVLAARLILGDLAPGDAVFEPAAVEDWNRKYNTPGLTGQALIRKPANDRIQKCSAFLRKYPQSSLATEVLWVKAQCRSLQLDEQALATGLVKPTASHPLPGTAPAWREITEQAPLSPQAALAERRLAELQIRQGHARKGYDLLLVARDRLVAITEENDSTAGETNGRVLREPEPIPSPDYYAEELFRANRTIWLIEANRVLGDPNACGALRDYLAVNPALRPNLPRLRALAEKHANTPLAGNWQVMIAAAERNPYRRAELLAPVAEDVSDGDAAMEANYELGILVLKHPDLTDLENIHSAREYFQRVHTGPVNPWHEIAGQRLEFLRADSSVQP